ncbi:MAG TPA: stalk domain-containing protein, partial [Bacillota bacterium]|nr:stalk domain-containing protein [Bacillota bacterium]
GKFFSVGYASAKYYTSFKGWGRYMFHSILFDAKGKKILPSAAEKLGNKASHGCIRMAIHDAIWVYKNVPAGTRVSIFAGVRPVAKKSVSVEVDGKKVSFGTKPRWFGGKLYVASRDVARWTGWQAGWEAGKVAVTFTDRGNRLELPASIPLIKVNGKEKPLKLPAFLIYQRSWVPVEDVMGEMGYQTFWQGNTLLATKAVPATSTNVSGQKPAPQITPGPKPSEKVTVPDQVYSKVNTIAETVYSGQSTLPQTVYNPS